MLDMMKRLVREDDGMEMVEWSIVAVVFALASALLWGTLSDNISTALSEIGDCVANQACDVGGGS